MRGYLGRGSRWVGGISGVDCGERLRRWLGILCVGRDETETG